MNKISVVDIPFYTFQCPDDVYTKLKERIKLEKFFPNGNNLITENFNEPNFENWINECLDHIKQDRYKGIAFDLKMEIMWANKTKKVQYHHKHWHANSILSGIVYFNVQPEYGKTKFYYPDPYWHVHNQGFLKLHADENENKVELIYEIEPKEGMVVIFPSQIDHSTVPHMGKEERLTVSFNTFFRGKINFNTVSINL